MHSQHVGRLKNAMRELQLSMRGALTQRLHPVSLLKGDCLNTAVVWIHIHICRSVSLKLARNVVVIVHSYFIQFISSLHGPSSFSFPPLIYIYHAHGPAGFALSSFPVFQAASLH